MDDSVLQVPGQETSTSSKFGLQDRGTWHTFDHASKLKYSSQSIIMKICAHFVCMCLCAGPWTLVRDSNKENNLIFCGLVPSKGLEEVWPTGCNSTTLHLLGAAWSKRLCRSGLPAPLWTQDQTMNNSWSPSCQSSHRTTEILNDYNPREGDWRGMMKHRNDAWNGLDRWSQCSTKLSGVF